MTDTQWPTLPLLSDADQPGPEPGATRYTLLVEETTGSGESMRWLGSPATGKTWMDRTEARRAAEQFARTYAPRHPMSEQNRGVYRVSPDHYLTVVKGATKTFAFRTTVAEPLD